ncbi:sulfate permease [soil metagenome]
MKPSLSNITRFIPIVDTLRNYDKRDLKGDVNAGVTVAIMLIPQGMAYAVLAGLPPVYGLYASIVPIIIYAIFGTSRQLGFGPVALISLLVLAGVGQYAEPGTQRYIQLAILTAFGVGVAQLAMGVFRAGFLVNFLSHPVLSGFVSAAAIIIGTSQIRNLLGLSIDRGSEVHEILWAIITNFSDISVVTAVIGIGSIVLMKMLKIWKSTFPAALTVVILGTLAAYLFNLQNQGLSIVGSIPSGLPGFEIVAISTDDIRFLWPTILAIALISFMESIAVAKAMASKRGYKIDANQELIGLGSANLVGSFFQAYPTTGGFSRTAVNDQAGAATTVASIFSALLVALTVMFLTPLFYYLPMSVLAAIIILAVISLFDVKEIKFLWKTDRRDFVMLAFTFLITLFIGIEQGIIAGVLISLAVVIYSSTKPHNAELGRLGDSSNFRNIERYEQAKIDDDVLIYRFDSSLYFANADFFIENITQRIDNKGEKLELVILDASAINSIDSTGLHTIQELIKDLKLRRIEFYIAGALGPVRDQLKRCGITDVMGEDNFFFDVSDALAEYKYSKKDQLNEKFSPTQSKF